MKVIVAQTAGFCRGVKRAVEKARTLRRQRAGAIYTDGPLIHNEQMLEQLRKEGVQETSKPDEIHGGTLIIRAHGISPERRTRLRKLPVSLADATCPDVAKTQGLIKQYASKGYHIVIFGDPGHAEVTGLLGYAQGRGFVVATPKDVSNLPDLQPVCLCSQSTQYPEDYQQVIDAARNRFGKVTALDTICDSTRNRQTELTQIAADVDAVVVVGSTHSANTLRLVELARRLRPTFHIQTAAQLRREDFKGVRTVGLSAGASTPDFAIEEIRKALEAM